MGVYGNDSDTKVCNTLQYNELSQFNNGCTEQIHVPISLWVHASQYL